MCGEGREGGREGGMRREVYVPPSCSLHGKKKGVARDTAAAKVIVKNVTSSPSYLQHSHATTNLAS